MEQKVFNYSSVYTVLGCKFEFIGEMGLCTFLSVAKEKYQKNRHLRKVPRYFP